MKTEKKIPRKKNRSGWPVHLIPPILLMSVYPLVFGGVRVVNLLRDYPWYPDSAEQTDFFVYAKMLVFLALALWMLVMLLDASWIDGKRCFRRRVFIPLYLYAGLTIVSTILSINRSLSLRGMWEQYENVFVLLGYVITAIYMAVMIKGRTELHIIHAAAVIGAFFQGLIGTMQLLGWNVLESGIGRYLLTFRLDDVRAEDLVYSFGRGTKNHVYMTLFNPNYAAVYIVIMLPIVLQYTVLTWKEAGTREKRKTAGTLNRKERVLLYARPVFGTVTFALLLLSLIGTGSRTGAAVTVVLGIAAGGGSLLRMKLPAGKKIMLLLCIFTAGAGLTAGTFLLRGESVRNSLKNTISGKETYKLESLNADGEGIHIGYSGHTLLVTTSDRDTYGSGVSGLAPDREISPRIYIDGARDAASLQADDEGLGRLESRAYRRLRFQAFLQDGSSFLYIRILKSEWYFIYDEFRGSWMYVTAYAKTDTLAEAITALPGWEKAFSERGYIWGRTLPLLSEYLLWGSGPDTFTVAFPQNDYRMRANTAVRFQTELLTKPHSMYLQTALQTGVLSLFCLLIFWMQALHINRKQTGRISGWYIAVIGYLLMGLLNDSVLAAAPLMWAVTGILLHPGYRPE